jgi:drug/metabolite transporter (DMT)-like permease
MELEREPGLASTRCVLHNLRAQYAKEKVSFRRGGWQARAGSAESSMRTAHRLHFKTTLLILVISLFGPIGNVLLSRGMKAIGPATSWNPSHLLGIGERVFFSGYIWLGIACLLAFFVSYMLVLTWADYSYVQPASAFAYVTVALLAHFALREVVSPLRWAGIAVICGGVLIVGRTTPRAKEAP